MLSSKIDLCSYHISRLDGNWGPIQNKSKGQILDMINPETGRLIVYDSATGEVVCNVRKIIYPSAGGDP